MNTTTKLSAYAAGVFAAFALAAGRLTVEADRPVSADAVTEAVEEAGYEVVPA